ncbi:hypothetical protein WJX74_001875 [Apatococcus lobatus]|uniref:Uncharacterized protein n=1 Tax=Apatococcus lobatus TaxID=904363 RepID=A0AAW1Q5H2_9CHLO
MGVLVNDEIVLPSGLKLKGSYMGFATNNILVTQVVSETSPDGKMYRVQAPVNIWVDEGCRKAGSDPVTVKHQTFVVGADAIARGLYAMLYAEMCKDFTDYTNMDGPPPPAIATPIEPAQGPASAGPPSATSDPPPVTSDPPAATSDS